jgi:hypothetical protein
VRSRPHRRAAGAGSCGSCQSRPWLLTLAAESAIRARVADATGRSGETEAGPPVMFCSRAESARMIA